MVLALLSELWDAHNGSTQLVGFYSYGLLMVPASMRERPGKALPRLCRVRACNRAIFLAVVCRELETRSTIAWLA